MRLTTQNGMAEASPWNYGGALVIGLAMWLGAAPAMAQQAVQPSFDPNQTERRFETEQSRNVRPGVAVPRLARPAEPKRTPGRCSCCATSP